MTTKEVVERAVLSNAALAAELERLGIAFLQSSTEDRLQEPIPPDALLAALAASNEARVRMALIPLFLAHPEFANTSIEIVTCLPDQDRITLICYYTAAMLYQREYARPQADLEISQVELPNLYGHDLGLPASGDTNLLLLKLAERHAELSGRPLNWYGTYEHAVRHYIRRVQRESAWATT